LLGAIGLQCFRPQLNEHERAVTYATWTLRLLPNVARAVASGMIPDLASTVYRSEFVSRGTFKGLDFSIPLRQGDTDE
jgi:CRISPR-associated protein Csb3